MIALLLAAAAQATIPSTPRLGVAEAQCHAGEHGPELIVTVEGLKDRAGLLRGELYPANDKDFLEDDNVLVSAGKTFRRTIVEPIPADPVRLCIRAPAPGTYSLAVIHARTGKRGFSLLRDGIGFGSNPKLGYGKPKSAAAMVTIGSSPTPTTVVMNYRTGLISFGPLHR
ncbi:DUF2141 domain-containing protein [Sphingomonas sp. KR1UV-12]|uniref:DUF2141 domain-containing protein n=1 Tax=Sphingomonas aurea TaxID=3063994 RepID=A0ABT9EKU1_9SPHN|nr:DUF2141 domain-containing protein [Sphingomonas sp. KR1UV-12]MDP1027587.1 DUF2141 domain-containing protein [Sphingomonas sp. KR1UV-12]